jgi:hypothetical protein
MSTERRIEANTKNAQLSTGPRTANGKARVASNAVKHGLTGKQIVLPNEKAADFDSFRACLLKDLKPVGELEGALAERIAADLWRLRRVPMLEAATYRRVHQEQIIAELQQLGYEMLSGKSLMDEEIVAKLEEERSKLGDPSMAVTMVLENHPETFANLWRHEAVLSRSLLRTLHELQRLQAARAGERVPAPALVDVDVNIGQHGASNPEMILQNKPI